MDNPNPKKPASSPIGGDGPFRGSHTLLEIFPGFHCASTPRLRTWNLAFQIQWWYPQMERCSDGLISSRFRALDAPSTGRLERDVSVVNDGDYPAGIRLQLESKGFNCHLSNELSETEQVSSGWCSYLFTFRTANIQTLIDVTKVPSLGELILSFDNITGQIFWRRRKRETEGVRSWLIIDEGSM